VDPRAGAHAQELLHSAGRWAATIVLDASPGGTNNNFVDACNKVMAVEPVGLQQCIARLYHGNRCHPDLNDLGSVGAADNWLRSNGYYNSLNHFVGNGGRNVVVFNELNIDGSGGACTGSCANAGAEPQAGIDPRVLGYLSYALQNAYWNGGNRLLYTLFPGPSGLMPLDGTAWCNGFRDYFRRYDLWNASDQPQTFGRVYGGAVDPAIANRTVLWHGGSGAFDRVALHCYEDDPNRFASGDVNTSRALRYLAWMRDYIDASGWVYVTEANGGPRCSNPPSCNCGDQFATGRALADFEYNANNLFRARWPYFLQAVYGFILMPSDCAANADGWTAIDTNYINGYNTRRPQLPGF
jgi:hypothetical protein